MAARKHRSGRRRGKHTTKRWLKPLLIIGSCAVVAVCVYLFFRVFGPNTTAFSDNKYFYIPTGSTYNDVLNGLQQQHIIRDKKSFDWVAKQLDYPTRVMAGRYKIHHGMSSFKIVRLLRSGRQSPVKLVINKLRTKEDFILLLSSSLEADSTSLNILLNDPVYLRQYNLDTSDALCAVIPNTYEFYWNTSAEDAFKRLYDERKKFWDKNDRRAKAEKLDLTPNKIMILASIIEEESNKNSDKPLIASVYLNRLNKGMRLMADPTVKFAERDFAKKRIYTKDTQYPSPYNTYLHTGLPPGPICTPSIKSIDAVLQAPETDYIYFCAKADFSGYHVFSSSYNEHLRNARAYQKALDKLNIQ